MVHRGRALWGALIMIGLFAVFAGIGLYEAATHGGTSPTARTFELHVTGSTMAPPTLKVREDDQVVLKLTADHSATLVLKGYDQTFMLNNVAPVSATFVADHRGSFEFQLDGKKVGELIVT